MLYSHSRRAHYDTQPLLKARLLLQYDGFFMSKKAEDYEKLALSAIKEHDLVFLDELLEFLPIGRTMLYKLGVNSLDTIKEALELNKTKRKRRIRNQWEKETNNTGLQIAYYRLLATREELSRLNNTHQHAEADTTKAQPPTITFTVNDSTTIAESNESVDE